MIEWTKRHDNSGNVIEARANVDGTQIWIHRRYGSSKGHWGFATYKNGPRYCAAFRLRPTSSILHCQNNSGAERTFSTLEKAVAAVITDINDLKQWSKT